MAIIFNDEKSGRAVHGGNKNNIHYNAYESMADEGEGDPMGRNILRRTDSVSDSEALVTAGTSGHNEAKQVHPVRGSRSDYHVSRWARGKGDSE